MDMRQITVIGIAACAFLLLLALVIGHHFGPETSTSQSNWDSQAIHSSLAGVEVQEVDPAHAAVVFLYDVDNRSNSDYRLANGGSFVIMNRLKSDGSLASNGQASLQSDEFVPAGNRARVALQIVHPFNWPTQQNAAAERSLRGLVASQVAGLQDFVLFDQTARYEIELPAQISGLEPADQSVTPN